MDILELAYGRIGDFLQTYPREPVTVVLYTQEQFRDVTGTPGWSGGLFDGRIRVPIRGGLADRRELERVLTHEYVHALVHAVAAAGVPAWLNEGLAAALETGGEDRARRDIGRGAVVPLSRLGRSFASLPAEAVPSAYAGSALAVLDILEHAGATRLMGLLADLGAGTDFDRAFLSWVFNQSWIFFTDVLPRAIKTHGGIDPEALRKASLETDIPMSGTIQGYGVKFFPPGHPMAGQNERSSPVVSST